MEESSGNILRQGDWHYKCKAEPQGRIYRLVYQAKTPYGQAKETYRSPYFICDSCKELIKISPLKWNTEDGQ